MKYFKQKPIRIAGDFILVLLVILMLIPSTRSYLLSGVASVRSFVFPMRVNLTGPLIDDEGWNSVLIHPDGSKSRLSDYKGKALFLNQWATWCPPCRAEMPSMESLFKTHGEKIQFVLVSTESLQKIDEYIKTKGYSMPVSSGRLGGNVLKSNTLPTTWIVSPEGRIVLVKSGAYHWNSRKVRRMIDNLSGFKT